MLPWLRKRSRINFKLELRSALRIVSSNPGNKLHDKHDISFRKNDVLHMHYTGTLLDGTEFDSSRTRDQEFTFTLGKGQVLF